MENNKRIEEIKAFAKANNISESLTNIFREKVFEFDAEGEIDKSFSMKEQYGRNLDDALDFIKKYSVTLEKGYSAHWAKAFAESPEEEDVAIRDAYEKLREVDDCGYTISIENPVYIEAYNSCIREGKSDTYANAFASRIASNVYTIEHVREYAECVEEQIVNGRTPLFAQKYAEHYVQYGGEDNSLYHADYYEKAILADKDESYAGYFADSLTSELANLIHLEYGEEPTFDHLWKFAEWKFKADARDFCYNNQIKNIEAFIRLYSQDCINEIFPGDDGFEIGDTIDEDYMKDILLAANVQLEDSIKNNFVEQLLKSMKN